MKRFLLFCVVALFQLGAIAQSDNDVVIEVAGEKILKEDFVRMFKKNSPSKGASFSQEELDEYLELFINYKMKLAQARELGLDTLKSYLDETKQYRQQLVAPYLNDATVSKQLIEEAYERTKEIVSASHILINIPANATPKDTLAAYNKAMKIRKRIIEGEDFATLAKEFSDDPSAKDRTDEKTKVTIPGTGGALGYFTSMSMIYPFETACYSMNVGEVSMPIRTRFGYHIIKLFDRVPAFCSTMDIAHIWVSFDKHGETEAESLINKAWNELSNDSSFVAVAKKYSNDVYSVNNGGVLNKQTISSLPSEYIAMLKNMKPMETSKPFRSSIGWHIVRPLKFRPIPTFEEQKANIENRISKDERSFETIESFAEKAKKEYGFQESKELLSEVVKIVNDSIFAGTWKMPTDFNNQEELFRIGDYSFTVLDFVKKIEEFQSKQTPSYIPEYIGKIYDDVVLEQVVKYADSKLESKYPDLKATIDEFRDGVLIFSITDRMVWNKSLLDTIGLQEYFTANRAKYNWEPRVGATLWSIDSDEKPAKIEKLLNKYIRKGLSNEEIKEKLAKKLKIEEGKDEKIVYKWKKYEKGDNKIIDSLLWSDASQKSGTLKYYSDAGKEKRKIFVLLNDWVDIEPKELSDCKGLVTSDYQLFLEKQWIEDLRNKYDYKVNQQVYKSIK